MPDLLAEDVNEWAQRIAEHRLLHGHQRFELADSPESRRYGVVCVECEHGEHGFLAYIPFHSIRYGRTSPWLNQYGRRHEIHEELMVRIEAIVDQAAHSGSPVYHPDAWAPGHIYSYWHPEVVVSHIQPDVTLEEIDAGWPIYTPTFWERL